MKCQYCNEQIEDGLMFCSECGQIVKSSKDNTVSIDQFWNKENNKKKNDVAVEITEIKANLECLGQKIQLSEKIESKKNYFRFMLTVFISMAVVAILSGILTDIADNDVPVMILIAIGFTAIPFFIMLMITTGVALNQTKELLWLICPFICYLAFFYFAGLGIAKMFVPLTKGEKELVKTLKEQRNEYKLLKSREQTLSEGLSYINSGAANSQKSNEAVEMKTKNGWKTMNTFAAIILVIAFALFLYISPSLL